MCVCVCVQGVIDTIKQYRAHDPSITTLGQLLLTLQTLARPFRPHPDPLIDVSYCELAKALHKEEITVQDNWFAAPHVVAEKRAREARQAPAAWQTLPVQHAAAEPYDAVLAVYEQLLRYVSTRLACA